MKKILLGMGTIASMAAPLAGVISCSTDGGGSSALYNKKQITIELGDPKWKSYFESITKAFNDSHKDAKYELKIIETKSREKLNNGAKIDDKDVADIFMAASNEVPALMENDFLAPITNDLNAFLGKVGAKGVHFAKAATSVAEASKQEGKYYGITQNTEGILFAKYTKTITPATNKSSAEGAKKAKDTLMLAPTNLWFADGVINKDSKEGNFKNVLTENSEGIYSQHLKNFKDKIKDLYTNIISPMKKFKEAHTDVPEIQEVFSAKGGIATTALQKMIALKLKGLKTSGSIVAPAGTWELENYVGDGTKGGVVLGKDGIKGVKAKIVSPSENYKQWGGAWEYLANARNASSTERMTEIKEIIQEFLKPTHALDMFKTWGKFMPTTEGLDAKLFVGQKTYVIDTLEALKGLTVMQKPTNAGFNNVWANGWANPIASKDALQSADKLYETLNKAMDSVVNGLNN